MLSRCRSSCTDVGGFASWRPLRFLRLSVLALKPEFSVIVAAVVVVVVIVVVIVVAVVVVVVV